MLVVQQIAGYVSAISAIFVILLLYQATHIRRPFHPGHERQHIRYFYRNRLGGGFGTMNPPLPRKLRSRSYR